MNGEQAVTGGTTYLLSQGVLGVVCIGLIIAVVVLYKRNQKLQDERLQDAKDVTKEVTTVLKENTQASLLLTAKIEAGKREGVS